MTPKEQHIRLRAGLTVVGVFVAFGLVGALIPGIFDGLTWWGVLAFSGLAGLVVHVIETKRKTPSEKPSDRA